VATPAATQADPSPALQAGGAPPRREAPSPLLGRLSLFLETIKFEHSVFALPFAVLSAFLLAKGAPNPGELAWVILAMISMRTFGMGANRLIDAEIDARNPRTAGRALPAGLITKREVWAYLGISAAAFALAVSQLDPLARFLSPVVLAVMVVYPYAKRFTWLSHLALGVVYLIVPPAVWIAMSGGFEAGIVVLGLGAMLWVSGFDVLYATADQKVDIEQGLHSIPARFGIPASLWAARAFHAAAAALIATAGVMLGAGPLYFAGAGVAAVLLAYENNLVRPGDLSKLNLAFFTMNGVIAVIFGVFASLDAVIF
jgi:4-hydroxybenzoate polyprenyltransferase